MLMYGGTAGEMARLINDSGVLAGVMEVTEKNVNEVSFDKMIEAIHVIQDEMGITGTTALEASGTISGSVGSMKSAWQNLVTEIGKSNGDISGKIDAFVSSTETAFENIMPRIEQVLEGIGQLVENLVPIIVDKLPGIASKILPSLIQSGTKLISGLAGSLIKSAPGIVTGLLDAVASALGLEKSWIKVKEAFLSFGGIFESIGKNLSDTVGNLVTIITETLGEIDFENLLQSFKSLLEKIEPIISKIGESIVWLTENVLAPLTEWTINEAIPEFFDLLSSAAETLKSVIEALQPHAEKLWNDFLRPLAEWTGDAIISALGFLTDALGGISDWINENPDIADCFIKIAAALAAIHISKEVIGKLGELSGKLLEVGKSALDSAKNVGSFLNTDWSKLSGATKATAVIGSFIAGWNIGTMIYEKWEEEIDGFLFPIFDFFVNLWNNIVTFFTESIPNFFSNIGEWFAELWENIKDGFSNIGPWFKDKFEGAVNGIKEAWSTIKEWFSEKWDGIKEIFSNVGGWFKDKFEGAVAGIKEAFSGIKEFFSGIWDGITGVFSNVGDWFGEKFEGAVTSIKEVFSGIKEFFSGIWDSIKDIFSTIGHNVGEAVEFAFVTVINGAIATIEAALNLIPNAINGAIKAINKLPGVDIDKIPTVDLPRLAKGGIVDDPTLALIGEAGKEAVVPLENNTEWIDKIVEKLNKKPSASGFVVENLNVTVTGTEDMEIGRTIAEKISEALEELSISQNVAIGGTGWK